MCPFGSNISMFETFNRWKPGSDEYPLPYPTRIFFSTRTLPGFFLKISGFRVVSKYHFQCRILSMTLISRGKWAFTRLINCQNFPHPSDMKTFVTKWSMEFPQQLNTTIIIWRSAPTSPDILVLVMMMAIKWCFWYAKYSWTVAIYATRNPTR